MTDSEDIGFTSLDGSREAGSVHQPDLEAAPAITVEEALEKLSPQWVVLYAPKLRQEGFDTTAELRYAEFDDLIICGVKRGHARRIIRELGAPQP